MRDVEFVQFHPTVMWRGPDAVGQQALVSEAVRGEGAVLYDGAGRRVMVGVHPQEDLRPATSWPRRSAGGWPTAPGGVDDHVYLDATHLGERFYERFPAITAACREAGIDPARERIPVAPAAHYACGGVPARLDGTTALRGLYAVGEVSCTGVHGANRLASNSLTESVVAGTRLGRDLAWELPERVEPVDEAAADGAAAVLDGSQRPRSAPRCPATSACCAMPPGSTPPPTCSTPSPARSTRSSRRRGRRGRRPTCSPWRRRSWPPRRSADREPGLPPAHGLPRTRATCGAGTSTCGSMRDGELTVSGLSVFTFHPLSDDTRQPAAGRAGSTRTPWPRVVRMAVAEDLMGGADVTSAATVPADQRSIGTFGSRQDGVVAGLPVAAAVVDAVCGDDATDVEYLSADGDRVRPGQDVARVTAPTRGAAHGGAHGAQPAVPPVGRRHADPPLGRRAGRHARASSATRARPRRGCGPSRSTPCAAAVGPTTAWGCPTPCWSRTTTCSPPAAWRRRSPPCVRSTATLPVEIEVDSIDAPARRHRRRGRRRAARQLRRCDELRDAVALRAESGRAVVLEASGGLTLEVARQVGETGVDYVAVGELTHSARVLDLGLDLDVIVA